MNRTEQRAYNKTCLRIRDTIANVLMEHHSNQPIDPTYWTPEAKAERQALRDIMDALMHLGTPLKDVETDD